MPTYNLYSAFILNQPLSYYLGLPAGSQISAAQGNLGTLTQPVTATTDLLMPDGVTPWGAIQMPANPSYYDDPAIGDDRVDVGSTMSVAGAQYTVTGTYSQNGLSTYSGTQSGGGAYIYEVSDGTSTLLLFFPNAYVGLGGFQDNTTFDAYELSGGGWNPQGEQPIFPNYAFNDFGVVGPDYIVEGTSGDDTINSAYLGDPEGDIIDNNDGNPGSPGVGNDDLVEAYGGNDVVFSGDGADTVYGGSGNDVVESQSGNDVVYLEAGNDQVRSGSGDDIIFGGSGEDNIHSGRGNDNVYGGGGNDWVAGETGDDLIYGESGDDTLQGDRTSSDWGNDTIYGGLGNDVIAGDTSDPKFGTIPGGNDDLLYGGSGDDIVIGNGGDDRIEGGTGDDTSYGGAGNDLIFGLSGDDSLVGDSGDDFIRGGSGNDFVAGESGDDLIRGDSSKDVTDNGNDTLYGGTGADSIFGDYGKVTGYGNDDLIYGGSGDDFIQAEGGNDLVYGDDGRDDVRGNSGDDTFLGGFEAGDIVTGGEDPDVDGDGNSDDIDVLDLSGLGVAGVDYTITYVAGDPEAGTVNFLTGPSAGGSMTFSEIENVICFTTGTQIMTSRGELSVEDLRVGDMVHTLDHGLQPIRWIGSTKVDGEALSRNPKLLPIRIKAGAFGRGLPAEDLRVSPQHRLMVSSTIARRLFDQEQVLVAAKQLVQVDGIDVDHWAREVEYFHILFDRHEIIFAEGMPTESLYTGREALKSLPQDAVEEIFTLFPELRDCDPDHRPQAARFIAPGREARKLAVHHSRSGKLLLELVTK